MEEDILYEFRNIVEESRIEDNRDYYIKLRDTLDFMENLLTRYKQLEEENKSKQKAYDDCYCEYKHYKQFDSIPKSKIKEKIEELKQKAISYGTFIDKDESFNIQSKISVLQDLLERSGEDANI